MSEDLKIGLGIVSVVLVVFAFVFGAVLLTAYVQREGWMNTEKTTIAPDLKTHQYIISDSNSKEEIVIRIYHAPWCWCKKEKE